MQTLVLLVSLKHVSFVGLPLVGQPNRSGMFLYLISALGVLRATSSGANLQTMSLSLPIQST